MTIRITTNAEKSIPAIDISVQETPNALTFQMMVLNVDVKRPSSKMILRGFEKYFL